MHQSVGAPGAAPGRCVNRKMAPRPRPQSRSVSRRRRLARESQLEATKVIGGPIRQDEGAVLAIELNAMPGAEERCATHLQAAASARCESARTRNTASRVPAVPRKPARREARERAAKPYEIIEAMRHEIPQEPAATVTARLPALEAQPCGPVREVPSHDHVPQAPDRAFVQYGLGAPP